MHLIESLVFATGGPESLFMTGVGGVFLLLGLGMLFAKVAIFREWFRVRSTPTMTTRSAAVGQVDLDGTISALSEPPVAPFTGTECAYACWEIEKRSGDDSWETTEAGDCTDRLVLEDETGEIIVSDPSDPFSHTTVEDPPEPSISHQRQKGYAVDNRTEYTIRYTADDEAGQTHRATVYVAGDRTETTVVGADEQPPAPIAEWCAAAGIDPVVSHRRRFREYVIPEGRTVYVHGQAFRDESVDYGPNLLVESDEARRTFLLADRGEDEFVELLLWKWKGIAVMGTVFALMGLLAFLAGLGVL